MQPTLRAILLGSLGLGIVAMPALAQPTRTDAPPAATAPATTPGSSMGSDTHRNGTRADSHSKDSPVVDAAQLESGANSFTEAQARGRMEDAGFTGLTDLKKDDAGFWRARAMRSGSMTDVAMDFRGRIAAGPGVAGLSSASKASDTRSGTTASGTSTTGTSTTGSASRDGTPGNPPSTMTGRAVDRMQGETPKPDGTPGNPPGTAAGRALDRTTGSNTTGANPNHSTGTNR